MIWKTLSSKSIYRNKWMEVTEDQIETATGMRLAYALVHKQPFALIIPWDGKHFYLVGQYRHGVKKFSWEFPQGHFEHSSILETAQTELEEETGLKADILKEIGTLHLAPEHHTQICHVFLATELKQGKHRREEMEKGMKIKKLSPQDFGKAIARGAIKDNSTIAAYALLLTKKLI